MDILIIGKLFQKADWKESVENKLENLHGTSEGRVNLQRYCTVEAQIIWKT